MPPIKKQKTDQVFFEYEGAYQVSFTVTDSKGIENSDSLRVIVSPKE
jgi:hypothetical protein